jgi:acetoacetyl-CoA synthetase
VTIFGSGAAFYTSCMRVGFELAQCGDLSAVRALGSTGSPLPPEVQQWGTAQFSALGTPDIWWCNLSGGTDVCCAFVIGNRELPPAPGRMQCRHLGVAVEAWNDDGQSVVGKVGELVCVKPIPSMPVYFWGDVDNARYLGSYFETFPGIWRHGDWLQIDEDGVCTISGRSDATINRQGLRMGTSELYSAVESVPGILDSLVIDLETALGASKLIMFLVLSQGVELDGHLRNQVADAIRKSLSPRFIPDEMIAAPGVPRTLSGKKQEVPIKRLLQGHPLEKVISRDAMANPEVLSWYTEFASRRPA